MLYFHFHSLQNTSLFPFISLLTHGLVRSSLFSFQVFRDFADFQFNSIVAREYTSNDLDPFKFIEMFIRYVHYGLSWLFSVPLKIMYNLLLLYGMLYKYQLDSLDR